MVKVAAAQIKIVDDIDQNLQKILDSIQQAKSQNADIVCFSETCLNSLEDRIIPVTKEIKQIQKQCQEQAIWCLVGSYVPYKDKLKNVIFLINRSGKIVYKYYKVHLWLSEKSKVIPGKTNKVINTEFGKIGIINCWDCVFPSYIQKLSRQGAKIIFCPTYGVGYEKDGNAMRQIPLVRSFENIAYYITCDALADDTLSFSSICHPLRVLRTIEKEEGIISADLDLAEIDSLRNYYDHLQ